MQTTQLDKLRAPPGLTSGEATMTAVVQDGYGSAPEGLFRVVTIDSRIISAGLSWGQVVVPLVVTRRDYSKRGAGQPAGERCRVPTDMLHSHE